MVDVLCLSWFKLRRELSLFLRGSSFLCPFFYIYIYYRCQQKSEGIPGPLLKTSILRSGCEAYFLNGYITQPQRFVSDTHLQLFGLSIRDSLGCRHHDQVTVTTSPRGSRRLGSMWRSCFISKICCVLSWY